MRAFVGAHLIYW